MWRWRDRWAAMVGRKERRGLATNLLVRGYAPEDDQQCQLLERRANQFGPQGGVGKLLRAAVDIHPCHPKGCELRKLCTQTRTLCWVLAGRVGAPLSQLLARS